ncbi:DUF190 domain-containing protein [Dyadobacter psychrophilus]|uniref:PII-like signaling protein n=1 Tax=Dyadobacter psychrophilus TaxID=651661 RepID=A0A1T5HG83_9BACT|nr:DUF190 domain-containing protein [Dyadobacter psychrophilus]SKC19654.1 PII-like signaling protein [Dyadobacter psychrophilus]
MENTDFILLRQTTLRIYLGTGQGIPGLTFWQRLWRNNLANFILKKAKESGIRQAIMFPVRAGFLKDTKLVFATTEIVPPRLPVCIEVTGEPQQLASFIGLNDDLLKNTFMVLENPDTYQIVYQSNQ